MGCRFCNNELKNVFLDLGNSPPANSFLKKDELEEPEAYYPLKAYFCDKCFLVQVKEYKKSNEIFSDKYAYFSSYSKYWLEHSKKYAENASKRFGIDKSKKVIEIASNDGYLLQYFKKNEVPVLGIEPSANTAKIAREKGIESIIEFFGSELADNLVKNNIMADLLIGNNVLAHVPDINDFVTGLEKILKKNGVITMEFPHLMNLIEKNQFDTIYHEHFSYFSFYTAKSIFEARDLEIFDAEELETHGGSLRIYAKHAKDKTKKIMPSVDALLQKESDAGMYDARYYKNFKRKAEKIKYDLLDFLIDLKRKGEKIMGYGAAAKGNTLLNYCSIKKDLIPCVIDVIPFKQGKYLPGSHIPIMAEENLKKIKPNYILILPWNHKKEIFERLEYMKEFGTKFVTTIPYLEVSSGS
ncbi:MAG: class I SAM-dependent methyltransferase [Nanoarchaeota archaeon]